MFKQRADLKKRKYAEIIGRPLWVSDWEVVRLRPVAPAAGWIAYFCRVERVR